MSSPRTPFPLALSIAGLLACGSAASPSASGAAAEAPPAGPPAAEAPAAETPSRSLLPMDLVQLDGRPLPPETLAGKAVLFVNVASRCGFTPQYAGLQALYAEKQAAGLVVVGVPCNQFGAQEAGSAEQIATFCERNYGVTFPILAKQDVNGAQRSPLYSGLIGDGADVRWNFEKFLVGRDGKVLGRWKSDVAPEAAELRTAIEAALR